MDIYSKPITQIRYPHISAFLDAENPESEILEYKRHFPKENKELARWIAAFANTNGGIIILGVAEKGKTGRPELPPVGIDIGEGEDEVYRRIQSVARDDIWHPVAPEIAVCRTEADPSSLSERDAVKPGVPFFTAFWRISGAPSPPESTNVHPSGAHGPKRFPLRQAASRAVVLIRVAESHETPHWTDHRQRAYVRVHSQNRFEDRLADADDYQRLWNRREAAVRLRESLIAGARERAQRIAGAAAPPEPVQQPPIPQVIVEAYALPCLPDRPRMDPKELLDFATKESGRNSIIRERLFPLGERGRSAGPIAEGAAVLSRDGGCTHYVQTNHYGLLHSWLQSDAAQPETGKSSFYPAELLSSVEGFLDYLAKLYERFQDLTPKPMQLSVGLTFPSRSYLRGVGWPSGLKEIHESRIQLLDRVLRPHELRGSLGALVRESAHHLFWAAGFGFAGDPQQLDRAMDILRGES